MLSNLGWSNLSAGLIGVLSAPAGAGSSGFSEIVGCLTSVFGLAPGGVSGFVATTLGISGGVTSIEFFEGVLCTALGEPLVPCGFSAGFGFGADSTTT